MALTIDKIPVYVDSNLLESMVVQRAPSRSELSDVLLIEADGLVLASENGFRKLSY